MENDFLAQLGFVIGTSTCCLPFIHALVISFIRFIAIYYPIKYKIIFTSRRIKQICIGMFLCSFGIGLPTIFFKSKYILKVDTLTLTPTYLTPSITLYQMFYGIFFYGIVIAIAFILNILNIIGLNKKKYNRNTKYSEKYYIIYCFFTLITSILMEIYFAFRIGGTYLENVTMNHIANTFLSWIGDIVTLGNFYFFILISKDIRKLLKESLKGIFYKRNYSYTSGVFFQMRSNDVMI
ncbi:G protein-coupled receptor, rhodopsin-like family-containing protein [Strongyloides ratti]|uniref:G protein-coupled receptor, rhodopsin-like family-containing protein n=1 Tax=Strongyloides ratti TaxID=34506 RepID=A0A090KWX1_STRRB|nr:G protein-coupled receptor, rhodopsin-like family-containing protein [Strongyloides ratti]CEF61926.1 G protein-coupled receptor, rhodopsin-like family-containing protein [Strongyloides ratti]